jgi:hypothetical protein
MKMREFVSVARQAGKIYRQSSQKVDQCRSSLDDRFEELQRNVVIPTFRIKRPQSVLEKSAQLQTQSPAIARNQLFGVQSRPVPEVAVSSPMLVTSDHFPTDFPTVIPSHPPKTARVHKTPLIIQRMKRKIEEEDSG